MGGVKQESRETGGCKKRELLRLSLSRSRAIVVIGPRFPIVHGHGSRLPHRA